MSRWICPRTRRPLTEEGGALVGPGGERYPLERGVPRFVAAAAAEDPAAMERLARLNAVAPELGWRAAVAAISTDPSYVADEGRARYLDLLPLDRSSAVLEVGCSLGQATVSIARRAGHVDAVDVVPGQAAFTAERCRQEGLTNVAACAAGDDCRLPFADRRFDVAILNLVLEWCGSRFAGDPLEAQRVLLSELARTLRPGGLLFLATKNRWSVQYLTGGQDEHCANLPFGSLLPRPLVELALRARGDDPNQRGLLHSHDGLARLLEASGFSRLRSFWATPDARYPESYVPADAPAVEAARTRLPRSQLGRSRRERLALSVAPAGLVKHIAPSLVFTGIRRAA